MPRGHVLHGANWLERAVETSARSTPRIASVPVTVPPQRRRSRRRVVEDRRGSPSDHGFPALAASSPHRLTTGTPEAACDAAPRAKTDAVAVVVYEVERARGFRPGAGGARCGWRWKTGVRRLSGSAAEVLAQPDACPYGARRGGRRMLSPRHGPAASSAARVETHEEAGLRVDPARVGPGRPPRACRREGALPPSRRRCAGSAAGDGSPMEEGGGVVVMGLRGDRCRRNVPDMKTEVALLRLADAIGYLPALDRFVDELPADLRPRGPRAGLEDAAP